MMMIAAEIAYWAGAIVIPSGIGAWFFMDGDFTVGANAE